MCVLLQLTNKEMASNKVEQKANAAQSRISELEALYRASEEEVVQLKRDKVLLVEHVADLQKKVSRSFKGDTEKKLRVGRKM